jgi:hypothetical protein
LTEAIGGAPLGLRRRATQHHETERDAEAAKKREARALERS